MSGEICAHVTFFNPTIESHIPSLWMVYAGCVFVASIQPSRTWMSGSFESVRWNAYMCVYRLDLGLYSHLKEYWGNVVRTHVNFEGKIPSSGGSEEDRICDAASRKTASPTHYQLSYSSPDKASYHQQEPENAKYSKKYRLTYWQWDTCGDKSNFTSLWFINLYQLPPPPPPPKKKKTTNKKKTKQTSKHTHTTFLRCGVQLFKVQNLTSSSDNQSSMEFLHTVQTMTQQASFSMKTWLRSRWCA